MKLAARAALTAGVAAVSVGALVYTPALLPATMRSVEVARPAQLAADARAVVPQMVTEDELSAALALIEQLAPISDGATLTIALDGDDRQVAEPDTAPSKKVEENGPAGVADAAVAEDPATLNAASEVIDDVYAFTRYWANYVSLELGPWLINWVPFGYLVSDQISIWYPDFVLPVVDSFVYDFLDPVVNEPLNIGVWLNGLGAIVNTAVNGVINGIADEINYIVSFGWFPIPLPPLPDFSLPSRTSSASAVELTSSVAGQPAESPDQAISERAAAPTAEPAEGPAEEPVDDAEAPVSDGDADATDDSATAETAEQADESTAPTLVEESDDHDNPVDTVDIDDAGDIEEPVEVSVNDAESIDDAAGTGTTADHEQSAPTQD